MLHTEAIVIIYGLQVLSLDFATGFPNLAFVNIANCINALHVLVYLTVDTFLNFNMPYKYLFHYSLFYLPWHLIDTNL